jgi:putative proteasome-type protease
MTYCMGMLLQQGLVMVSDSLTNAGVDQIAKFRKMTIWETPGERVLVLMTAGNLAVSQAVVGHLNEGLTVNGKSDSMTSVATMGDAARLVGAAVRAVDAVDGAALRQTGIDFDVSMILGGQIAGGPLRLFLVYKAGNFIESTPDTPFFQIGENKYGKPILDRVITFSTNLADASKCALISMDSTLRSNISVGPPIDLLIYRRDSLKVATHETIADSDPYVAEVRAAWGSGLRAVFSEIRNPPWDFG